MPMKPSAVATPRWTRRFNAHVNAKLQFTPQQRRRVDHVGVGDADPLVVPARAIKPIHTLKEFSWACSKAKTSAGSNGK
jgi:hypothetical protein